MNHNALGHSDPIKFPISLRNTILYVWETFFPSKLDNVKLITKGHFIKYTNSALATQLAIFVFVLPQTVNKCK